MEVSKLKAGLVGAVIMSAIWAGFDLLRGPDVNKAKVFQDETGKKYMRIYKEGVDGILDVNKAKVFQDETGKKYMRIYKEGVDSILVEDPNNSGDYVSLKDYLSNKNKKRCLQREIK